VHSFVTAILLGMPRRDALVPNDHVEGGFRLGSWVAAQRKAHQDGRLSPERHRLLATVEGWTWDGRTGTWDARYELLRRFVQREGHARVPDAHIEAGYELGSWVANQRTARRKRTLAPERARMLESLDQWSWSSFRDTWEEAFSRLQAFAAKNGHARVPQREVVDGHRLGAWVSRQRAAFQAGSLSRDRMTRLEGVEGWTWNTDEDRWLHALDRLRGFLAREGHAAVPNAHREGDFALGKWVSGQRAQFAKQRVPKERVEELESLPGWTWKAPLGRRS